MKDTEKIEKMANVPTEQEQRERARKGKEKDELIQALLHYATAEASGGIKSLIDCEGCTFYLYEMLGYRKIDKDKEVVLSREKYVKKICEEYENGIKDCKFHYEYIAIPHIIQVVKDNPNISDEEVEEVIRQVGVETKE